MELQTEVIQELNRTTLRLRVPGAYREDYQIRMLKENRIRGLAGLQVRGEGEETLCEYDVTGLTSLRTAYLQKKITAEEMEAFVRQLLETIRETKAYLLNPGRLLLTADQIFCEEGSYTFCYFPLGDGEIRTAFHRLMEDFVQWTDYRDIVSVKAAFLLHKETMKENYSIGRIADKLGSLRKEAEEEQKREQTGEDARLEKEEAQSGQPGQEEFRKEEEAAFYDDLEHDWISRQEAGSRILRETDNLWSPVKRFLHRHRRPKWGEWDGVYVDEEEL